MDSKKVDKWLMIISGVFLIIGLSFIIYCINYVGTLSTTQGLLFFIGTIFTAFFSGYLILSFIMWTFQSIFKKLSDHFKVDIFLKLFVWIIISVILFVLIRGHFTEHNYNSPTNIIKSKLLHSAIETPELEHCSDSIIFNKGTYRITSESVTKETGLLPEQIIFINPQDINKFEVKDNVLQNKDFYPKSYIICAICDVGKTKLQSTLIVNNINTIIDSNIEGQTLCAVYPKTI
ncbi:MAG: hypothetical protein WCX82_00050 [archaeon]|jgi:hypothetical protein